MNFDRRWAWRLGWVVLACVAGFAALWRPCDYPTELWMETTGDSGWILDLGPVYSVPGMEMLAGEWTRDVSGTGGDQLVIAISRPPRNPILGWLGDGCPERDYVMSHGDYATHARVRWQRFVPTRE